MYLYNIHILGIISLFLVPVYWHVLVYIYILGIISLFLVPIYWHVLVEYIYILGYISLILVPISNWGISEECRMIIVLTQNYIILTLLDLSIIPLTYILLVLKGLLALTSNELQIIEWHVRFTTLCRNKNAWANHSSKYASK